MRLGTVAIIFALVLAGGEAIHTQAANPAVVYTLPTEFWLVVAGACITIGVQMGQLARVRTDSSSIAGKVAKKTEDDNKFQLAMHVALAEIRRDLRYLRGRRRDDRHDDNEGTEA
jgi:hypothetical protein